MKKHLLALAALLLFFQKTDAQKFDGLAKTPPMGWNSWNTFACDINEKLVRDVADVFVEKGFREAGYEFIVLDDCWMAKERDALGNLIADPLKFPSGMKSLADYVHAKGLKFGLYNCAGAKTCAGFPGSRGHEFQDALAYASWGVDYLKYDWCNTEKLNPEAAYTTMRDALFAAKRPVVFSICEWGDGQPWNWAEKIGHLWRVAGDITPCFDCELNHGSWSSWGVMKIAEMRPGIRKFSGPGHWNDFDMMEVGNGMTAAEDRAHFALWAMLASPLFMGNDLRTASPETVKLLTDRDLIAINQDAAGIQGFRFSNEGDLDVWVKPLAGGDWAVCFLNRKERPANLEFDWKKEVLEDSQNGRRTDFSKETFQIRDVLGKTGLGSTDALLKTTLGRHDVLVVRLSKK